MMLTPVIGHCLSVNDFVGGACEFKCKTAAENTASNIFFNYIQLFTLELDPCRDEDPDDPSVCP